MSFFLIVYGPSCLIGKESTCQHGDLGSIHGSEISPGEGNGNPLYILFTGKSYSRGVWWATVHWVSRVGHDWVTKQQNSDTHNSAKQNFPTDQCMKL